MAEVIAIANQKGGCSKTTVTANLGIGLAMEGKKVMVIDADPQGSLTASLGHPEPDDIPQTLATLMTDIINEEDFPPDSAVLSHEEGVDLIPANMELSGLEVSLSNVMSREMILKEYKEKTGQQADHQTHSDDQPAVLIMSVLNRCFKTVAEWLESRPHYFPRPQIPVGLPFFFPLWYDFHKKQSVSGRSVFYRPQTC